MLTITASTSKVAFTAAPRGVLTLTYRVQDTDPFILTASTVIDWGDGSYTRADNQALPIGPLTEQHAYGPGTYVLRVNAVNLREPKADRALYQVQLNVTANNARADAPPVIFGPILPLTDGTPNALTWNFNIGRDGVVLSSSIRMLLLTAKGERVMDPNYGTDLKRLIFSLMGPDLESAIQNEITTAVSTYEPRVLFKSARVQRSINSVNVLCEFNSLLSNQPITLSLGFPAAA